ncbi:MAG: ABC transporter ATP-binding protein/permease [Firmicutes bacterium]|nr:ABC transporter ATP-binding protein/permease [Bacillota bacterium]
MLNIIKRILNLAGESANRIKIAFVISIFEGIFAKVPIILVLYILIKMVSDSATVQDAWIVGIIGIAIVILRAVSRRLVDGFQAGTGREVLARERMKIGDRLKRLPMGYFSEGNIGNVTAVITSDLVFIEEHAIHTLSKIVTGYLSTAIGVGMLTVLDYRMGIISIATIILAILGLKRIQKVAEYHSGARQEAQSRLIGSVLEYVKGITVIKSFNMVGDRAQKINNEFEKYRDVSIDFEKKFNPPLLNYESCFAFGIGLTILASSYFAFNQTLDMAFMLMMLIFVFELYLPFKELGGLSGQVRIMEAALNRYEAIHNVAVIDEKGKDIAINHFDIEFKDVAFAYEQEEVLRNISFKVPERSMTALVGKSGCGKTTIANLTARFWDVQKGEILVGGVNVKDMTCDSLLKNISMVFQNVYLFHDTILNNIKFGKQDAALDEVIDACKKARCHDFIMELEHGYDTVIGEGGSSLSGGEKQRISIARAILKDAPIILLDEATASVDPDNEEHIQMAITELVKDKTLVVIAHRLSTIKSADQILVIDNGKLIQKGTHDELLKEKGQYHDFWQRRIKARSWKIQK